jgi:hypothetical protein
LQGLFDSFIVGEFISATLEETVMSTDLKRLSPGGDEVWEFKIGKKKYSQWRIFGRFAQLNHFVALTGPTDRTNIDYPSEIVRCRDEWRRLLANLPPVYGSNINDYISPSGIPLGNPWMETDSERHPHLFSRTLETAATLNNFGRL